LTSSVLSVLSERTSYCAAFMSVLSWPYQLLCRYTQHYYYPYFVYRISYCAAIHNTTTVCTVLTVPATVPLFTTLLLSVLCVPYQLLCRYSQHYYYPYFVYPISYCAAIHNTTTIRTLCTVSATVPLFTTLLLSVLCVPYQLLCRYSQHYYCLYFVYRISYCAAIHNTTTIRTLCTVSATVPLFTTLLLSVLCVPYQLLCRYSQHYFYLYFVYRTSYCAAIHNTTTVCTVLTLSATVPLYTTLLLNLKSQTLQTLNPKKP
jgi:hypothetical protein